MANIIKKPYEISLWDEKLVWHRKKLKLAEVNEDKYEPGKFYS
jgi:hypothetical protein